MIFRFGHEAYVLSPQQFQAGLHTHTSDPLGALFNVANIKLFVVISLVVAAAYTLNFLFASTRAAIWLDRAVRPLKGLGPLLIRLTVGISFLVGASQSVFFGPELPLHQVIGGGIIRAAEFVLGIMILLGLWGDLAALAGIAIFFYLMHFWGSYLVTYANYFGELVALLLFGSGWLSADKALFKRKSGLRVLSKFREYEIPLVRVLYGVALIFAGYTIKFQHQTLTVEVYNQYHLYNFFHLKDTFIAAGAGLAEIMIGTFILMGFALRFTILISLAFITLSLLYFREAVWPHLLLYGISISLLINAGDLLTIDRYLVPWVRRVIGRVVGKKFAVKYLFQPKS